MARTLNYQKELIKRLKDPKHSLAYLNAAFLDEDPRIFLIALRNVLEAHNSISKTTKSGINAGTITSLAHLLIYTLV